jgi:D-amino-acid dehydrogenase
MMPNMMPRVGRGQRANVFYNTGHGHLGWTLSAVTADMVGGVVQGAFKPGAMVAAAKPGSAFQA